MPRSKVKRMTLQRRIILEELAKVTSHPTADEVYGMVRLRLPSISLGTVYRDLEVMSKSGFIQKLEAGGQQKRFDGNAAPHHHVRCLACGRVGDLQSDPGSDVRADFTDPGGYAVTGYRLEYTGLCPGCQRKAV